MNTQLVVKEWHLWMRARKAGYPGMIIWSDGHGKGIDETPDYTVVGERTVRMGPYIWTEKQESAKEADDTELDAWANEGGAPYEYEGDG